MTTYGGPATTEQREEMFRQFQSEQIRRQTSALERIVSILQLLTFLIVAGILVGVGLAFA